MISPSPSRLLRASGFLLFLFLAAAHGAPDEIVVAGYNIENYTRVPLVSEDGWTREKAKPESEIEAVIRIVKEINPDILGVSEMGPRDAFEDFKARLDKAGLGYHDFEYVDGPDPGRHLALLSRYPIVSRQSMPDVSFVLDGAQQKVKRGFLDVTVRISPDYQLRLVGVHLKSKLYAPEGEALVRRNEAHLLRAHIEKILAADPSVNLLLYGDFNDTKNEPAIHEIMGARNAPDHMSDLWLKDGVRGHLDGILESGGHLLANRLHICQCAFVPPDRPGQVRHLPVGLLAGSKRPPGRHCDHRS